MRAYLRIKKRSARELFYLFFLVLCFIPFLFPNPIVTTNIQPYASLCAALILVSHISILRHMVITRNVSIVLGLTFLVSVIVMLIGGVSIEAIRGVYNYFALFVIPCAVILVFSELSEFPENLIKTMIITWFLVASIQFFVYRGFATRLISSVRWSYSYRGVVGLASEPSFLGIMCFYFLHIIKRFRTQRFLYYAIVLVTGILYAQSTIGIIFIAGFYVVFLLDRTNSKKGLYVWTASIVTLVGFGYYLSTRLSESRLNQMIKAFLEGGMDSILTDGSASIRFYAIGRALDNAASNMLMPNGFGARIGSAYGGLLVEIGIFAIPAIILISYGLSLTFEKKKSRVVYFIVVTLLLLNNTQIGNPLLLLVVGLNLHDLTLARRTQRKEANDAEVYQISQKYLS